jgi:hypothetical protein
MSTEDTDKRYDKESKKKKSKRELGFLKGKIKFSKDFELPLPPEILKYFEGED